MKQLEEVKIDQLLGIINPYPATTICHFSDGSHLLSKKIYRLCVEYDYTYQLNCTSDVSFEKSTAKYTATDHMSIKRFDLKMPRYVIQAKKYDYLFVTSKIPDDEKSSFLNKTYATIKNAGLILIFIPKGDLHQMHLWSEYLQENYFVATNMLDIFSNHDLLISKKMHGWGG